MNKYIVLAGGSGSRLWPYSRSHYPKQILKVFGDHSLLQDTCLRIQNLNKEHLFVVTNEQQKHLIQKDLDEIELTHPNLIIEEPYAKNTAAAICLAALTMNPDDCMIVLPSDHIIKDSDNFNRTLEKATRLAEMGYLVTLGIKPN